MYDSIVASAIPVDVPAVAGYVDGRISQWSSADWARFSTAKVLHICTWGPRNLGDTLDIEYGDSIVSDARPYALNAISRGIPHPKLYMSRSDFGAVLAATSDLDVRYWVANYTNIPHLFPGSHGTQWASNPNITGGNFDLSMVTPALFD